MLETIEIGEELLNGIEKGLNDLGIEKKGSAAERRAAYIEENKKEWQANGMILKGRRDIHNLSLRCVAELLGTSATRLSKLEKGQPVSMSKGLTKSYHLLIDHIELRKTFRDLYEDYNLNWRL